MYQNCHVMCKYTFAYISLYQKSISETVNLFTSPIYSFIRCAIFMHQHCTSYLLNTDGGGLHGALSLPQFQLGRCLSKGTAVLSVELKDQFMHAHSLPDDCCISSNCLHVPVNHYDQAPLPSNQLKTLSTSSAFQWTQFTHSAGDNQGTRNKVWTNLCEQNLCEQNLCEDQKSAEIRMRRSGLRPNLWPYCIHTLLDVVQQTSFMPRQENPVTNYCCSAKLIQYLVMSVLGSRGLTQVQLTTVVVPFFSKHQWGLQ